MFPKNGFPHDTPNQSKRIAEHRRLFQDPIKIGCQAITRQISGISYTADTVINNYINNVCNYYRDDIELSLEDYYSKLGLPEIFTQFGLSIEFDKPTEIFLHDESMQLPGAIKRLISEFGVLILRNVFLTESVRDMGHRNRFPNLNFHVDRMPEQVTHYSVYTRDPFDELQKHPRTSSTLFIPPLVGYLEAHRENKPVKLRNGLITNINLFDNSSVRQLLNHIVLESPWNAATGMGEIVLINNCKMLHASYYPDIHNKGYRIGVRYCS